MVRPESWTYPIGASPARAIAGEFGRRTQSVAERRRAERGVSNSSLGGANAVGRSTERHEFYSLVKSTAGAESWLGEGPRFHRLASSGDTSGLVPAVAGAARMHRVVRNDRGLSRQPLFMIWP